MTIQLTKFEEIFLKAMPKSNYNDGDDYKTTGVWTFSVTDEITEYTEQQAKGVVSSLVQKGLIDIWEHESGDTVVVMTEKGKEAEQSLLSERNLKHCDCCGSESQFNPCPVCFQRFHHNSLP